MPTRAPGGPPSPDFHLFQFQERAVQAALAARGGIVEVPCGGGKTVIGMEIAARAQTPTTWLCHTADLAQQALGTAEQVYGIAGDDLGFIGDGTWRPGRRLTVAIIQSLRSRALDSLMAATGCVVLEEAHHAPADTFRAIVERFDARYRVGLTATPERPDGLEAWMHHVFGPTVYRTTYRELAAGGRIVLPNVGFLRTGVGNEPGAPDPQRHWAADMAYLAASPKRNALLTEVIAQLAAAHRFCLVLTPLMDHAVHLTLALLKVGLSAFPLAGDLSPEDRADCLDRVRRGEAQVIVATTLADEGLDLPNLDTLVLAAPSRAEGRLKQRAGRVMRVHPGKPHPLVIDLVDEHPVYKAQAQKRWAVYREIGAKVLPKGTIQRSRPLPTVS